MRRCIERFGAELVGNMPRGWSVHERAVRTLVTLVSERNVSRTAIRLMDEAAESADDATRAAMCEAFVDATWYEEQFWARSYDLQRWDTAVG